MAESCTVPTFDPDHLKVEVVNNMPQKGVTRRLVMDAIANDYEDFAMICEEVQRWATEEGALITREEVWSTLSDLVSSKDAKVILFAPTGEPVQQLSVPSPEHIHEVYFLLTDKGRLALD